MLLISGVTCRDCSVQNLADDNVVSSSELRGPFGSTNSSDQLYTHELSPYLLLSVLQLVKAVTAIRLLANTESTAGAPVGTMDAV